MSGPLGCVEQYTAVLHWRGGAHAITQLAPLVSVEWQRRRNEQARATVVLAKAGASQACCEALSQISPWAHELSIFRGPDMVWQGPVLTPSETIDTFTIEAVDITGWFAKRAVVTSYTYSAEAGSQYPPTDAVVIARRLLGDAFAANDPGIRAYFTFTNGTNLSEQAAIARVDKVAEMFDDLVTQGLDYTTVGRRLVITPPGYLAATTRAVTALTDEQLGGGVTVSIEGASMATQVFNHSSSYQPGSPIGAAGGVDAFYGLVQEIVELNDYTGSQANMNAIAKQDLATAYPAPVVVRVDDDAALHPDAPIGVDDLVCGIRIDVILTRSFCMQLRAPMTLESVTGTWDVDGERITVSLAQIGGGIEPTGAQGEP